MTSAIPTAATLTIASRRRRPSTRRRAGSSDSISSRAADAAIESFRQSRRRRHGGGDEPENDLVTEGIRSLAANVAATAEAQGIPRWLLRAAVLAAVGLVLAVAVFRTLPLLARHTVSGIATLDGKPLGRVGLSFHALAFSPTGDVTATEVQTIRADPDGAFQLDRATGLRPGLYAVVIRPGESQARIPEAYRTAESTPLRLEVREDLSGVQLLVRSGAARGPRRTR